MTVKKSSAPSSIQRGMCAISAFCASMWAAPIYAQDSQWWFDVEVILFERTLPEAGISENFENKNFTSSADKYQDLFTPYLTPDHSYLLAGLDFCEASRIEQAERERQLAFAFPEPQEPSQSEAVGQTLGIDSQPSEALIAPYTSKKAPSEQPLEQETGVTPPQSNEPDFAYEVVSEDVFDSASPTSQQAVVSQKPFDQEQRTLTQPSRIAEQGLPAPTNNETAVNLDEPPEPIKIDWIEWQIPNILPCAYAQQTEPKLTLPALDSNSLADKQQNAPALAHLQKTPVQIEGVEWQQKRTTFLLPTERHRMSKLYAEIRKDKTIQPILHSAWRQQVGFGEANAASYRLFAGENFADRFDTNGEPKSAIRHVALESDVPYMPAEEKAKLTTEQYQTWLASHSLNQALNSPPINAQNNLFERLNQILKAETDLAIQKPSNTLPKAASELVEQGDKGLIPEPIWQLDGYLKVYLKYVNRVPYLHIESELDYRWPEQTPAGSMQLKSANFEQLRRIVSKQVHYFDHPLFGMIVRLERHKWPVEPDATHE